MKINKSQKISLKVILLFTIAIFSTFVGDYLHSFLGDWKCLGSGILNDSIYNPIYKYCNYAECGFHDPTWHWGYRHWLYLVMCITLFIIQIIDIISFADSKQADA